MKDFWIRVFALPVMLLVAISGCAAPNASPTPQAAAKATAPSASAPTTAPRPAAEKAAAEKPAAASKPTTQRLVMSVLPLRDDSNDVRNVNQPEVWSLRPMYEYLIGFDPQTGKLIAQLATEWKLEPDGASYRFMLRRGIPFHKGNGDFSAKDVVFSWKDLTQQDSTHGESGYWRNTVKDIEVVNDYEVVFRLGGPAAGFLRALSEAEGGMEMRSKAQFDAKGPPTMETEPYAGTGPYQFKERALGQYLRYERVPYAHWRATPDFPEFEFRFQREASTRMAALLAGEVQVTTLPRDLQADVEKRGGYKVIQGKLPGFRAFMTWHCCWLNDPADPSKGWVHPESPLRDVKVRKALNKAINRDEINKPFFDGKGERRLLHNFHPTWPGWNPQWEARYAEEYGYDPARARALLAEAGKPNLSTQVLIVPFGGVSSAEDIAEAIAGYWTNAGVNVERVTPDPAQMSTLRRQFRFSSAAEFRATSAGPLLGSIVYTSGIQVRGSATESPDTEAILREIKITLDESKQEQLWRQLGDLLFEQQRAIPLFWLPAEAVVNSSVVADYDWPGSISGTWTHIHQIKAAQ
jgi:ABC-type transport system substrate-binding protein